MGLSLADAIDRISSAEANSSALRDRLYVVLATLPAQVIEQAGRLLDEDQVDVYSPELDRIVVHFRGHAMTNTPGNSCRRFTTVP
jgi:hypothetical protein